MKAIKSICLAVICLFLSVSSKGQSSFPADVQKGAETIKHSESDAGISSYIVISYDDGVSENYCAWQQAGNSMAVKFIMFSYPATIVGARVYVGDGSYPAGGNILNQPFLVSVYLADGVNGLPGTLVDSISATVSNYEWVEVTGLYATVNSDFYIAITQLSNFPDCIPVGVDETPPKSNHSYSCNVLNGGHWEFSPYQDLMINALVSTTVGLEEASSSKRVRIYPNPANESVKIEFSISMKTITINNASGQTLLSQNITNQPAFFINTSSMLSGIYFIRFDTSNGDSLTRKLVVLH